MTDFFQTIVTGLAVGSFYALIALGYTMVYGILKFINFAHSDVFVAGAWLSLLLATFLQGTGAEAGPPLWSGPVILVVVMISCGTLGFLIERFAYRPLRGAPRLNVLITAIGVSLLLQNVGQLPFLFGTQPQRMPSLFAAAGNTGWSIQGVRLGLEDLLGAGTAVMLMLALEWLILRTQTGRAMRAVSHSIPTAALMGIDVNRIISITFVLGSALAAAAGLLYAMKYPVLNQPAVSTWVLLGLKAFIAAVVGGIGNVRGAMLGGFCIGLLEQLGAKYISSELKDVYVFALLILVLLLRPTGILGRSTLEKV